MLSDKPSRQSPYALRGSGRKSLSVRTDAAVALSISEIDVPRSLLVGLPRQNLRGVWTVSSCFSTPSPLQRWQGSSLTRWLLSKSDGTLTEDTGGSSDDVPGDFFSLGFSRVCSGAFSRALAISSSLASWDSLRETPPFSLLLSSWSYKVKAVCKINKFGTLLLFSELLSHLTCRLRVESHYPDDNCRHSKLKQKYICKGKIKTGKWNLSTIYILRTYNVSFFG